MKKCTYVQNLLDAILLLAILTIIKVPGHSKLDSPEAKGNHLTDISTKNTALKGTNNQILLWSKGMFLDNLENLTRYAQKSAPEKEKQYWKSNKKRTLL